MPSNPTVTSLNQSNLEPGMTNAPQPRFLMVEDLGTAHQAGLRCMLGSDRKDVAYERSEVCETRFRQVLLSIAERIQLCSGRT